MYTKEINIYKELQKDALSAYDTCQEKAAMKGIDRLEADISELTSLVADDRLEGAEDLVGELSNLLKTWQGIDYRADQLHFKNIFEKIALGLDLLKQRLRTCAFNKLDMQEIRELENLAGEVVGDPSVEYFGLEWTSIFTKCYNLGMQIRLLKAGLEQGCLNTSRLRLSLQLIHHLSADTQMHAAAVSSGRLGSNSGLRLQQQLMTNIGRASSFRTTPLAGGARKPAKYQGSKTDSALATETAEEKW